MKNHYQSDIIAIFFFDKWAENMYLHLLEKTKEMLLDKRIQRDNMFSLHKLILNRMDKTHEEVRGKVK